MSGASMPVYLYGFVLSVRVRVEGVLLSCVCVLARPVCRVLC